MPLRATDQPIGAPSTPDLCWARQQSVGFDWELRSAALLGWGRGRGVRRGARAVELAAAPGWVYPAPTPCRVGLRCGTPGWLRTDITSERYELILEHPPQRQVCKQLESRSDRDSRLQFEWIAPGCTP
jgi:hypothetical protein